MNQQTQGLFNLTRKVADRPQTAREWASLKPGEYVEVWSADSFLYGALVDDRANDGDLIWVIENGTGYRRLFVRDDAVKLYSFEDTAQH